MRASVLFLGLGLTASGCSGGGPSPLPPSPPPPGPVAHPGKEALRADWTPPLGVGGLCSNFPNPFHCELAAGSAWGLLQQSDLGKFSPAPGSLGFDTGPQAAMALISAVVLDRASPLSLEEVVRIDSLNCGQLASYQGVVAYGGGVDDGDRGGRYRAEYISCFPGDLVPRLWLYSPTWAQAIGPQVGLGPHRLRMDWWPGEKVDYWLDGQLIFSETAAFAHDPLDAPEPLHPGLWFGGASGAVLDFQAWGTLAP